MTRTLRILGILTLVAVIDGRAGASVDPAARCTAAKIKAASKLSAAFSRCYQKGVVLGGVFRRDCFTRAVVGCRGGCSPTGGAQAVMDAVLASADRIVEDSFGVACVYEVSIDVAQKSVTPSCAQNPNLPACGTCGLFVVDSRQVSGEGCFGC